ncbi:chromosomal replication initiator protein DnaA [Marinivivus vitaminiproducens]|uniref:chromosomal replication initiator protein DnaA n=1 Tax=Marinivivus vitaminiproducens TaxID=3035935 RepID=UPI00279AEFAD|nr:chromosomal replication initiator protein DnaA [Geminicoccaceae bacterium SCSIO 64248]
MLGAALPLTLQWEEVRRALRGEVDQAAFGMWLEPLVCVGQEGERVVLAVPTRFLRDWVDRHYADRLRALWRAVNPGVRAVSVEVGAPAAVGSARPERAGRAAEAGTEDGAADAAAARRPSGRVPAAAVASASVLEEISAPLDPRGTFDDFVVGKPNEFAFAAAKRVASSEAPPFNPLFLYGGVGLGKTHLMHAVAWHLRLHRPDKKVIYLSAEKFMYQFIKALREHDTMSFKEMFRTVDVLMVDDVQFISGKDSTQEEFFHTFNTLVDRGRQIIISADRSPSDLSGLEERIRSRLGWGLVADIHPTTFELRLGILQQKAQRLATPVPERVLEFLAQRITSNVRELEGSLNRIVAQAQLVTRDITIDMAQEVLADILRANDRKVTIEEIQRKVAEHYGIKMADMHSARRARIVARPRQVAMYLAKQLTPRSLPEIGRKFGGRDHTTVMHAVRKIEELQSADPALTADLDHLRRSLGG